MNVSALYKTYDAMCEPNYELKVGGKALGIGDDARLMRLECALTCTRQAGALMLEAVLDIEQEHGAAWLDAFQPGAVCSLDDFIPLGVPYTVVRREEAATMDGHSYIDGGAEIADPPPAELDGPENGEWVLE